MKMLVKLGQIVEDRRNWPTFLLAGAIVFIGALLLDSLGLKNGLTMVLTVIAAAFLADRFAPFHRPEDAAS